MVQISAYRGQGKSLVCNEAMVFFSERFHFQGAMISLNLRQVRKSGQILEQLYQIATKNLLTQQKTTTHSEKKEDTVVRFFNAFGDDDKRSILNLDNASKVLKEDKVNFGQLLGHLTEKCPQLKVMYSINKISKHLIKQH